MIALDSYAILVDDTNGAAQNILRTVSDYSIVGGPEQPIRILRMTIPKKIIDSGFPTVVFSEGLTKIEVNAVGTGTYIIESVSLEGGVYSIIAYGTEDAIRDRTLLSTTRFMSDPYSVLHESSPGIVDYIEGTPRNIAVSIVGDTVPFFNANALTDGVFSTTKVRFPVGTRFWTILNTCALLDEAYFFFDDKFYYVKYGNTAYRPSSKIYLYRFGTDEEMMERFENDGMTEPEKEFNLKLQKQIHGQSEVINQGMEAVANMITVFWYNDSNGNSLYNHDSHDLYGMRGGGKIYTNISAYNQNPANANIAASNAGERYIFRYTDPQTAVSFSIREQSAAGWESIMSSYAYVDNIYDAYNGMVINNLQPSRVVDGQILMNPARLRLSLFSRRFPEGYTKYTFGMLRPTDLTQALAQMKNEP